jgi:NAD(P)-dependent dehydrogenase (short-subunit alcohol dehydrogenase family)
MSDSSPVWFITGSSRGFGLAFTEAALARGDSVVATARSPEVLDPLVKEHGDRALALALDVTDRVAVASAVDAALDRFGRIDIAVNNAGYGLRGAVEEVTEAEARTQMEVNFFGALWVTQAAIAPMRAAGSGHIIQVSSMGGVIAFPALGLYHASKWALEGMTESLAQEVAPFGIKVTIVEPGGFRTDWNGSSMQHSTHLAEYEFLPGRAAGAPRRTSPGDPVKAAAALMQIVDDPNPPLRVLMGVMAFDLAQEAYHRRLAEWDRSKVLSRSTEWTED